jgi:hypothetical protein
MFTKQTWILRFSQQSNWAFWSWHCTSGCWESALQCHIPEDTLWHEVVISRITLKVCVREGIVMYLAMQISSSWYSSFHLLDTAAFITQCIWEVPSPHKGCQGIVVFPSTNELLSVCDCQVCSAATVTVLLEEYVWNLQHNDGWMNEPYDNLHLLYEC